MDNSFNTAQKICTEENPKRPVYFCIFCKVDTSHNIQDTGL